MQCIADLCEYDIYSVLSYQEIWHFQFRNMEHEFYRILASFVLVICYLKIFSNFIRLYFQVLEKALN